MATPSPLDAALPERRADWLAAFQQLSEARDAAIWAVADLIAGAHREDDRRHNERDSGHRRQKT